MEDKAPVMRAFKKFARLKGKSTLWFDKTTMNFIPGSFRLQFLKGGKVRVAEVIDVEGTMRMVTKDLDKKVFIELTNQLKGFMKELEK